MYRVRDVPLRLGDDHLRLHLTNVCDRFANDFVGINLVDFAREIIQRRDLDWWQHARSQGLSAAVHIQDCDFGALASIPSEGGAVAEGLSVQER